MIQELVQEWFGPVDLDRSAVRLDPVREPTAGCPGVRTRAFCPRWLDHDHSQHAGYASAKEYNERYRYLLAHGSSGLGMAFDLPPQLGLDSDDPRCLGELGRTGVAIDTIDDMRTAFDGIPLDQISTSMRINAPASVLLLLYELVGEEHGVSSDQLRGTTENDILRSTSPAATSSTRRRARSG
ncbi:MAG: methylmalonyl-CoA mutase family protein [Solirubrobacteraceae bacterium]